MTNKTILLYAGAVSSAGTMAGFAVLGRTSWRGFLLGLLESHLHSDTCLSAAAEGLKWDVGSYNGVQQAYDSQWVWRCTEWSSLLIPQVVICTTLDFVALWKIDYWLKPAIGALCSEE
eukprot:scaffold80431_cov59-Attheya_sp.AAC.1